jgi:quercetin dioxygenase-like cupin family protein
MQTSRRFRRVLVVLATTVVGFGALATGATAADSPTTTTAASTTTKNGITRAALGQASSANAPGQVLYLQRVTIAPGAKLAEHFHQGTQVARVVSGVLTYDIASGTATVTHVNGTSETFTGPATIKLRPGESLVETQGLVHHGSNAGKKPVVIELAALLQQGAPLATPVGEGATGTPLHLTAALDSQSRTLHTAGADDSVVYGWNLLTGTATLDGAPVAVELLGNVSYVKGSGPIFGFVTYTFADGSTLGVQMQGAATAAADGSSTQFAATLGVVGGTGRYVNATGTGTFVGSREAALGTTVSATFDLTISGAS